MGHMGSPMDCMGHTGSLMEAMECAVAERTTAAAYSAEGGGTLAVDIQDGASSWRVDGTDIAVEDSSEEVVAPEQRAQSDIMRSL